ncbi:MAG: LuxR family transcriptional regulator [Puniceicoccaceae bacterium]|nr:MAG: LuxR family transcriptional regulator [Puniceicoccaceae bacterium]
MEQSMAGGRPGQPFERLHHPTVPDFTATVSLVKDKASLVLAPLLFIHFHPPAELPGGLRVGEPESRMVLLSRLTPREQEVALLAAEGLTNEEVADRLKKSLGTVKNQLQSVFQKLNIHNRARLISVLGSGPVG